MNAPIHKPIHPPTGEEYPITDILAMSLVPNDKGQRDRMVAELPHLLDSVRAMTETFPEHAKTVVAKRPWWAFWMTEAMVVKMMRSQLSKVTYVDDDKGTMRVRIQAGISEDRLETLFDKTEQVVPSPMLTLYYVQLEGTAEHEEGDVFWSAAFNGESDPASILVEASELEASESGQFHSGRVMRCYGPFAALQPVATMGVPQ